MALASIALTALLAVGAQNSPDLDKTRPVAAPTAEPGGGSPSVAQTRYCIVETPTGSRLQRRECRTRKEWLDRGFDPLVKE